MEETSLETEMKRRVRRHLLMSGGGFLLAIALMVVAGAAAKTIFGASPPAFVRLIPIGGILLVPAIGFWSTFKNLRCPACEGSVIFQASAQYSMFGAAVSKSCSHCGEKIFADDIPRRFRRMIFVLVGVGVAIGALSAILSAMSSR